MRWEGVGGAGKRCVNTNIVSSGLAILPGSHRDVPLAMEGGLVPPVPG